MNFSVTKVHSMICQEKRKAATRLLITTIRGTLLYKKIISRKTERLLSKTNAQASDSVKYNRCFKCPLMCMEDSAAMPLTMAVMRGYN